MQSSSELFVFSIRVTDKKGLGVFYLIGRPSFTPSIKSGLCEVPVEGEEVGLELRACCCSLNATSWTQPQHVVARGGLQPFRNQWLRVVQHPHGKDLLQPLSSHVSVGNVVSPYCTSFATLTLESIQQKPICSKAFPSSAGARTLHRLSVACRPCHKPLMWVHAKALLEQQSPGGRPGSHASRPVTLMHRKILLTSMMCHAGFPRPGWEEAVLQEHRKVRFSDFKQHKWMLY